jgi:hypothetical protein
MHERQVSLQIAVNTIAHMISQRVQDYVQLKKQLPSFGTNIDRQRELYLKSLEHEVYGSVLWYYESPSEWT